MKKSEIKIFLDEKVALYNNKNFIESDPIQIPHLFNKKEDIEIAAFLTATISWGNRKMIIKNAKQMVELLDHSPHDFVLNHTSKDLKNLENFVHRTFNGHDFIQFTKSLQHIYKNYNGLEAIFTVNNTTNYFDSIHQFKKVFFEVDHLKRTQKHVSDPLKKSAAKRIHMFLRWMVRDNTTGVDFGIWKTHNSAHLSCPLDVHSGNVARKLKLLKRKQNDLQAVIELDNTLRSFDAKDPVKYDFALFGLGVFEKF